MSIISRPLQCVVMNDQSKVRDHQRVNVQQPLTAPAQRRRAKPFHTLGL